MGSQHQALLEAMVSPGFMAKRGFGGWGSSLLDLFGLWDTGAAEHQHSQGWGCVQPAS